MTIGFLPCHGNSAYLPVFLWNANTSAKHESQPTPQLLNYASTPLKGN